MWEDPEIQWNEPKLPRKPWLHPSNQGHESEKLTNSLSEGSTSRTGYAAEGKISVLSYSTAYESREADLGCVDAHSLQNLPLSPNQGQVMEAVGASLTHELPGLISTPGHPSALKHMCFHWTWIYPFPAG